MDNFLTKTYLALLIFLLPFVASSQVRHTVSGYIKDETTGETLIGATVSVADNLRVGTSANEYGFYSLTLKDGKYQLLVSAVGYASKQIEVAITKDQKLNIQLKPSGTELSTVNISAKTRNDRVTNPQMSVEHIDIKEINQLPVLLGERDVLKTIALLPGVKSTGDGNSGFYVRGGGADQNLILLDEALVYNPAHLLGFFSTFNSDAIKDANLYKGNMPAQYGGRLSSVLDVKMRDGSDESFHATGGIGLIASRLSLEGPIEKGKGSFLISGRRTYADQFLRFSSDTGVKKSQLYFYDLNLKASYKLGENDRLFLSGYFGRDKIGVSDLFGLDWGNSTATLRWNHQLNAKLFSNTSVIYNDYQYNIGINSGVLDGTIRSRIKDWNFKEEFSFYPNAQNTVRFGVNSIYHNILPGAYTGNFTLPDQPRSRSWENGFYANNTWKASDKLNIEYGVRLSTFSVIAGDNKLYNLNPDGSIADTLQNKNGSFVKTYVNPEPRVSASYTLNGSSSLKMAYSRNAQYLHLITNSAASNPTDRWVSTNNIIKPEFADQFSAGYFRNLADNKYEFSVESYYKHLQNQIDYRDGADITSNDALEPQLLFGKGRAYGIELLLRKKKGRFTGWISYTLSRTEKQIAGINNGDWYAARQDRTHDISLVGMYQLSPKWTLSANWVYYTGNAVSFPSGKYMIDNRVVFYYTERNGYRMPAYHRMDFAATCKLADRKRFSSELVLGLYNLYGRENAYAITFRQNPDDATRTQALQTALFRLVPSVTYNFKF